VADIVASGVLPTGVISRLLSALSVTSLLVSGRSAVWITATAASRKVKSIHSGTYAYMLTADMVAVNASLARLHDGSGLRSLSKQFPQ
jgi:hypothetical protein